METLNFRGINIMKSKKNLNLFGISLIALSVGTMGSVTQAMAQVVPDEVVVVTATGRAQAIQDIPVAVTSVNAATIQAAGITDVRTLTQVTPSYRVETGQSNAAGTTINIRGIGTSASNPGFEGAVAVFIDGVYRSRSGSALSELPKLERIEVLRGPQGTLFGRNTSAGAVSVVSAKPKFERNTYAEMTFGDLDLMRGTLGTTGPLSENTAYRFEVGGTSRQGTIREVNTLKELNNRNRWFTRGQIFSEWGDDATFRLIADFSKTDENCCAAVRTVNGTSAAAVTMLAGLRGLTGSVAISPESRSGAYSPNRSLNENVRDAGISGELNWNLGDVKLTSITAYRDWDATRGQDIDFSGIDRAYREGFNLGFKTFTQEVRFNGTAGNIDWLVGGFYSNEKTDYRDTVRFGNDAARYVDALAMGSDINGAAPGGTGFTVFGSLGPGAGRLFEVALNPGLTAGLTAAYCGAAPTPTCAATAAGAAASALSAYATAFAAAAPLPGDGQQKELTQVESTSASIFTHNIISLTDDDKVTIGLRYNSDKKDMYADLNARAAACGVMQNTATVVPGVSFNSLTQSVEASALATFAILACNPVLNTVANGIYRDSRTETAWNGLLSYSHDFSDDLMIYITASRGYKSGGFNLDRSAFNIKPSTTVRPSSNDWEFKPEFTNNFELGWKWSGLPGRTTINGAIFRENIEDYQYNSFTGFNFLNVNIPKVVSQGLELEMVSKPAPGFTVSGGLLLNDVYVDGVFVFPRPGIANIADGTRLPGSSETVFTGSVGYKGSLNGSNLGWMAYLDARYESGYSTQTLTSVRNPLLDQGAYTIVNGRIGIGHPDGSWGLELWGRNLGDVYIAAQNFGVPEQNNVASYLNEPRTYGVTLRADF